MANLITGSSKNIKHPIFWIGVIGILISFFGFFKIGNFAFNLIKDQTPITSMAQNANLKLNSKEAGRWFREGIDVLDNLINRRSQGSSEKAAVEEEYVEEELAEGEYSGASFVFSCIFIFMLLKLVLSMMTMIFRESLDMVR